MKKIIYDINCEPNNCTWPNCACKHEPVEIAPQFMSAKAAIITFVLCAIMFIGIVIWALELTKP